MKVLILGSGVIGTTSAYYLAKAGHEVTVVDRQPGAGLETSFANAGELSYGYASPWAGPGIPQKAIKWLLMTDPPPGWPDYAAEVRRLADRLTAAGWKPAQRGPQWHELRFVWDGADPPPTRLDLATAEQTGGSDDAT